MRFSRPSLNATFLGKPLDPPSQAALAPLLTPLGISFIYCHLGVCHSPPFTKGVCTTLSSKPVNSWGQELSSQVLRFCIQNVLVELNACVSFMSLIIFGPEA